MKHRLRKNKLDMKTLPDRIDTVEELDDVLTRPTPALRSFVETLRGPLVVLGAGGKMGPTLCVRAKRTAREAESDLDVIAVSRFSSREKRSRLEARGVRTIACDLMDRKSLRGLPDAENIIYLVGFKFGTTEHPARTWAGNTLIPAHVAERYAGGRIAALSTGNVYPLTPAPQGGSLETDALVPAGEYAGSAVARERIFEYFSQRRGTPVVLIRLNYAVDLRYGVLVDLAQRIEAGKPVDVRTGYLNCIWQGDANDMILRSLRLAGSPPRPLNLTSPETFSVRDLAHRLAEFMDRSVSFTGVESETALLSNPEQACVELGEPPTPIDTVLRWTAHWVESGKPIWNRPTHFEVRDGQY